MIKGLEIAGAVLAVYFIIAMLFFFNYLYFKKGSWKKSLLHIFISVLLLTVVVMAYMLIGQQQSSNGYSPNTWVNGGQTAPTTAITEEIKEILAQEPEEASKRDQLVAARLASATLTAEEESLYLEKIKAYYVYQELSIHRGTEEEILQRFNELRVEAQAQE